MPSTPPPPSAAATARVTLGLAAAASVGLIAALTVVRYLPTHDGPQHVFLAHLENHFSDPAATYADYYKPTTALTSKGFSLVFGPISELLPWRSALQVTLAIILLTWAWGAVAFTNSLGPRRRVLGLVGFAVAFQWPLYMGFFSYVLSTGLGLFTLAVAFGVAEWTWKRRVSIAALLVAQAVSHVFAAELVGLTLAVLVACRHPWRRWPRELGLLAAMGIPTALIGAHAAGWFGGGPLPDFRAEAAWPPLSERVALFANAFAAGPWWRAWPPVLLSLAGMTFGVRRTMRRLSTPEERTLLIMGAICTLAALLLPLHSRSWEFMSVRFIPMAVMFGVALVPVETFSGRVPVVVQGAIIALTTVSIAWAGWHNKRLETACGPALAGLDADIKRDGPRLPIILDPGCNALSDKKVFELTDTEPLLNVGALYAVQQGGVDPYLFTVVPQLHGFVLTRGGFKRFHGMPDRKALWGGLVHADPVAQAGFRQALLTSLAMTGAGYRDVIFYGTKEDRNQISERGYVMDFERDGLWIGHYRGCPLKLEVQLPNTQAGPLIVQYGWQPMPEPAESQVISMKPDESGGVSVEWPLAPCGPVWVRAGLDKDASGKWKPEGGQCEGAGGDGKLALRRTAEAKSVRCSLVDPSIPR